MEKESRDDFTQCLALALIYLTSWEENTFDSEMRRSWKGYEFGLLDRLREQGLVAFNYTANSLYITDEGVRRAQDAVERLQNAFKG